MAQSAGAARPEAVAGAAEGAAEGAARPQWPLVGNSKEMEGWRSMPAPRIGSRAVSVVVPCYEESQNARPLVERLFKAMRAVDLRTELIFVDDESGEDSQRLAAIVDELRAEGYADVVLRRRAREEGTGLSSAVVLGLGLASHPTLVVMDGDLQHEPESVPQVCAPILEGVADFSIGSRNVAGAKLEDWPWHRKVVSFVATAAALPLTSCSDPMSGFFALSKETFLRGKDRLNPMGYKIGLELLVRCDCARVQEVPIIFRERVAGESKLTPRQTALYLVHLSHLYSARLLDFLASSKHPPPVASAADSNAASAPPPLHAEH